MDVMVTTDGSWRALQALPHAARLAEATRGQLVLARILDPMTDCPAEGASPSDDTAARLADEWRTEMLRSLASFRAAGRTVVGIRSYHEDVTGAVLRVAAEEGAAVVAMSSRGAGMLRHAFMGSVALGVLSRSEVPVLVAGDRVAYPPSGGEYHLLVPTDGSEDSLRAVRFAATVCTESETRITLLRVYAPSLGDRGLRVETEAATEQLDELRATFPDPDRVGCVVRPIVMLGGIDTVILGVAHEIGATAIALSTHGHSARYHLFAGSTALAMLKRSTLPVLLLRTNPTPGATAF